LEIVARIAVASGVGGRESSPQTGGDRAIGAFAAAMVEPGLDLHDELPQRGVQRVIDALCGDVRPRRDEVRGDPEGRTGLFATLDEHASFLDAQPRMEGFELPADQREE
jgi:hypothetical protein